MTRRYVNNDPRQIAAEFQSRCAETGKVINKGDRCIYYPLHRKVFHLESNQAAEFLECRQDVKVLGADY